MRLPTLFLILASLLHTSAWTSLSPRQPQPRSYDTHSYYALELPPSYPVSVAQSIAQLLGVELVEPLGELAGHWIVRSDKPRSSSLSTRSTISDPIVARFNHLRSKRQLPALKSRALTPLLPRKRMKRVPPASRRHRSRLPSPASPFAERDDSELLFAKNDLHLADPMLGLQWHLINTELKDIELNVTGLWSRGVTGKGVKVVIVDDGLDMESEDLKPNFYAEGSWDFNDHQALPQPKLTDDQHGTRCAGEIAAAPNDVCGVGVSYDAKIAGVRILSGPISDADEAAALNYAYQLNEIYSCSWGPPDDGRSMEAPEGLILKAMVNGVQNGRAGKGSVFVFAAGNGGGADDQCNFDGYTNSIFSVTVGAVDKKGLHPYYSELCSAMMLVTPSSGSGDHIHTTDTGKKRCAHNHGGTSAAAPLAAGVYALALQVRPDLSWRDIQHLSVRNAVHFNAEDPDWEKTASGRLYSYKYGYGRLDAGLFVEAAEKWTLVKPQAWFDSPAVYLPNVTAPESVLEAINNPSTVTESEAQPGGRQVLPPSASEEDPPEDDGTEPEEVTEPVVVAPAPPVGTYITPEGVTSSFEVTQVMLDDSNFEKLEHVTVRVWIDHQRRGDVEVELESPSGIKSVLARQRRFDDADTGFPGWKFMTLKHWEEDPIGTWTLTVRDQPNPDKIGYFIAWSLQLWGEALDATLAKPWAPAEEGEPDEEQTGSDPSATLPLSQKPKPTEHLPGDHGEAEGESDQPGLAYPTGQTGGNDDDIALPTSDADEGLFDGIEGLANNTTWLAGAGFIILLTGAIVGGVFWMRRRRRQKAIFGLSNNGEGARGAYAPVSEDVPMGLLERSRRKLGVGKGAAGGGSPGSKDLYDAFGDGPSDEDDDEEDEDRVGETTALRYHDDFLGDDEPSPGGEEPPRYRDQPEDEGNRGGAAGSRAPGGLDSNSGSSSSWQDAEEDVRRS